MITTRHLISPIAPAQVQVQKSDLHSGSLKRRQHHASGIGVAVDRDHLPGFVDIHIDTNSMAASETWPKLPLSQLAPAQKMPGWQVMARFFEFLMESEDPDEVIHRAAAALGLLPQVSCTEIDKTSKLAKPIEKIFFPAYRSDAKGSWLSVKLHEPHNEQHQGLVQSLLALTSSLHARESKSKRLREEAFTDPLTGLWNRRGFDTFVEQALCRASRQGEFVAMIICDLDHFKVINDELGHQIGDQALITVADAMRKAIRPSDLPARLGGDEMAILLSGSDAQGAMVVAQRLRRAVVEEHSTSQLHLKLSLGIADTRVVADLGDRSEAIATLIRAADQALYAAKAAGRNCAQIHPLCDQTIDHIAHD